MSRRKAELGYIEDVQKRRVSFAKRRSGLMKKARELAAICNADVGLIMFSENDKLYEFASSSMTQLINRYNLATGHSTSMARPDLPSTSLSQLDLSSLLEQQAEEIRSLKEEAMALKSENRSLLKRLEKNATNNKPTCYEDANFDTALTLGPTFFDASMERLEKQEKEFGSNGDATL